MNRITTLRREIDKIDSEIVNLIFRRQKIVAKILKIKQKAGLPPIDHQREREILKRLISRRKVAPSLIRSVWEVLFHKPSGLGKKQKNLKIMKTRPLF